MSSLVNTSAPHKVWVKASAEYTEIVDIDGTPQMGWSVVGVVEGYTTTIGDGGKVTINGGATRSNGFITSVSGNTNLVFKNFIIKNHTGSGASLGAIDRICWKNCEFIGNGTTNGHGINSGETCLFENCKFNNNSLDGVNCAIDNVFVGCEFKGNTQSGIDSEGSCAAIFCLFVSNGQRAFDAAGVVHDTIKIMVNCTVDGDGKDTTTGFHGTGSFRHSAVLVNNIIYDCITGIDFSTEEGSISRNNLLNSNSANYANSADTYSGEVTGAPAFIDEANQDYTLSASSPAKNTGYDASNLTGDTVGKDIGAHEGASAATGGRIPRARYSNV